MIISSLFAVKKCQVVLDFEETPNFDVDLMIWGEWKVAVNVIK